MEVDISCEQVTTEGKGDSIEPWSDRPEKIPFITVQTDMPNKFKSSKKFKNYLSMEVHPIIKNNPQRWSKHLPKMNLDFNTTQKHTVYKQNNYTKSASQTKYSIDSKNSNIIFPTVFKDLQIERKIYRLKNNLKSPSFCLFNKAPVIRSVISSRIA